MDFGKVDENELDSIDFTLPPDHRDTTRILPASKIKGKPQIWVGCAKWGRKDWVGKIYPTKTKEADFLKHYARQFNCIELNATYYKMPTEQQTQAWKSKVTPGFKFCPKFVEDITHRKRLKDCTELTDRFLEGIKGFGDTLGPLFLMPNPSMGPKTLDIIKEFIASLPKEIKLFLELRHKEWFSNPEAFDKVFSLMESLGCGAVITDSSGRRDCVHMRLTTPTAFIRFVGNGLHPTDYTRIDAWVQRMKLWVDQGIQQIYFFMHQHEEIHSPELSKYLIEEMNKHMDTQIPLPKFFEGPGSQSGLFDA